MSSLQPFRVALLLAALVLQCSQGEPALPGQPVIAREGERDEVLVGPRTTEVIGRPTNVRAYNVLSPLAPHFAAAKKGRRLIDNQYPILEEARVDPQTAARIASILLDPDTYDPGYGMACNFDPGYAVRFEKGNELVDVIICFKCGDLDIVPGPTLGEERAMHPFGRAGKPLYEVIMQVFPAHRRKEP